MNLTYDVRQIELNTTAPEDEIHFVCKCNSTTKYSALLHASKHTHTHTRRLQKHRTNIFNVIVLEKKTVYYSCCKKCCAQK